MKKICISRDWKFRGPKETEFRSVDLPHDYSIEMKRSPDAPGGASNGFFEGGVGTYLKYFTFESGVHTVLDIDGAYMCTSVTLNGRQLTMHPHGYTPLLVDLTPYIFDGKLNKLQICTNALQCSTRWYSGAGLYRDVFLWQSENHESGLRMEPWDVFVTTPTLSKISVRYKISADKETPFTLEAEIFDGNGVSVMKQARELISVNGKTDVTLDFDCDSLKPWSQETPTLYSIVSRILVSGVTADTDERRFGVRTVSADAEHGLLINGKETKLRGGCIHHDHGAIGAADYPAACRRKLTKLKEAGFNALRIAHNPPSELLMDMCDEMGIIIMDEAFDAWNKFKGGEVNYHLWFADEWARDVRLMVMRDRNHPSVICYSAGNEIPESDGLSDGAEWSVKIRDEILKYDTTRLTTVCTYRTSADAQKNDPEEYQNDFTEKYGHGIETWKDRTSSYFAPFDICGYNYMFLHYEEDHEKFPERVMWGSETHALNFYRSWNKVLKYPYVIGDFTWTAYDNLGEAGTGRSLWARDGFVPGITLCDYPWRSCFQGDLDLCGYRRPQSYFREAVWLGNAEPKIFTTHPEHYGEGFSGTAWHWYDVHETWTFDDKYIGKPVKCEVYTDADEIKWYLNGKFVADSKPNEAIATADITYEKGELCAAAFKNGKETGRCSLKTNGEKELLVLSPETDTFTADGRDLCFVDIFMRDENGEQVLSGKEITCDVDGAELVCVFSGDPCNEDDYTGNKCHMFEGRALAAVKTKTAGNVKIKVSAENSNAEIIVKAI